MRSSLINNGGPIPLKDAAKLLNMTIETLRAHAHAGLIPCHIRLVKTNYKIEFFMSELEAFLRATYNGPDWLDVT